MSDEKCPWCERSAIVTEDSEGLLFKWRCEGHCGAEGPWRPTREEALATMEDVCPHGSGCEICREVGEPDRPMVVCRSCHDFVDEERIENENDAKEQRARADKAEAAAEEMAGLLENREQIPLTTWAVRVVDAVARWKARKA